MSFYFPRQKIYITVPYKNGFTSALNFFVRVENLLESMQTEIKYVDSLEELNINHDFGVHAQSGKYSSQPFRMLATNDNQKKADIRFFIIRDPYLRFSSFWNNRIMSGEDSYFIKTHARLSSKYDLDKMDGIQMAVTYFLNELAKPYKKVIRNQHLWPQIFLTEGKTFDFITETENLNVLPRILSNKSDYYRAFANQILPNLNTSKNNKHPLIWNDEMNTAFKKLIMQILISIGIIKI